MTYAGRRILVTGGSSGIGADLARQLGAEGAKLAIAARRLDRLAEVAATCGAVPIQADVSEEPACKALIASTVQALGGLDVLLINAGVSMNARFVDVDDLMLYERLIRVNYLAAVWLTHHAMPHLRESRGQIVVVSSLAGKWGLPTRTGYSAAKHALHGFFDSLRPELAGTGVDITLVCPGPVSTEIRDVSYHTSGATSDASWDMPSAECARQVLAAARSRKREKLLSWPGWFGSWVHPFAPWVLDRVLRNRMLR
jgi:short-subunit dehydrogenase